MLLVNRRERVRAARDGFAPVQHLFGHPRRNRCLLVRDKLLELTILNLIAIEDDQGNKVHFLQRFETLIQEAKALGLREEDLAVLRLDSELAKIDAIDVYLCDDESGTDQLPRAQKDLRDVSLA